MTELQYRIQKLKFWWLCGYWIPITQKVRRVLLFLGYRPKLKRYDASNCRVYLNGKELELVELRIETRSPR
jgi:hypothetical protein